MNIFLNYIRACTIINYCITLITIFFCLTTFATRDVQIFGCLNGRIDRSTKTEGTLVHHHRLLRFVI